MLTRLGRPVSYVEVHALAGNDPPLDKLDAPLLTLSASVGVKWLGLVISFGAMLSFFALALSCMNAGARLLFTMGRYGIFPATLGAFNDAGLFGAMGFCAAYVLISVATPCYLKKIGELTSWSVVISVIALILLIVPIVGTVWPVPPAPMDKFAYIFGGYVLAGAILVQLRSPSAIEFDHRRKLIQASA